MRVPYVKVLQSEAEEEIKRLRRNNQILREFKIRRAGDFVLIPVRDSETVGEFEENEKKTMGRVGSFERISDFFIIKGREGWEKIMEEIEIKQSPRAIFLDEGVAGPYRIRKLRRIYGTGKPAGIYRENGLRFLVDLERAYFSPRLAALRKRIVDNCVRDSREGLIVDMYAGIGPIVIPLLKAKRNVVAIDINPEAIKLLVENLKINKVSGQILIADSNSIYQCIKGVEQLIMNNPTQPIETTQKIIDSLNPGAFAHLTHISKREEKIHFRGVETLEVREVHGYSPSSSLFYYRLRKK